MKTKRFKFVAQSNVIEESKQIAVTDLLNAEWYVLFTDDGDAINYKAQSLDLLLEGVKYIAEKDKDFKNQLTDLVIDIHTENKTNKTL